MAGHMSRFFNSSLNINMENWFLQIPPALAIWCGITIFYSACMWILIFKDFWGAILGMGFSSISS